MSYTPSDLVDAANLQPNLNEMFANTPDTIMKQKVPFLEWLLTPTNRGQLSQSVTIGNGQTRTVEVQYSQEFDAAQVSSSVANPLCSDGSFVPPNNSQEYTIDTSVNRAMEFKVTRAVLETAKVSPQEYVATSLLKAIAAVEQAINTKEAASAVLQYGTYSTDATDWATASPDVSISANELVVQTRVASSTNPFPYTAQNLAMAAEYNGYTQAPIIFSGTLLRDWTSLSGAFSQADYGLDLGALYAKNIESMGISTVYDKDIATALGAQTKFLMIQPGALQLAVFTASDWTSGIPYQMEAANYYKTVIYSPRTGLPMDLVVVDNCGVLTFRVYATTKLLALPSDMFNPDGRYSGVTYVNKGVVTNS